MMHKLYQQRPRKKAQIKAEPMIQIGGLKKKSDDKEMAIAEEQSVASRQQQKSLAVFTTRRTSPQMTENSVLRALLGLSEATSTAEAATASPESEARLWETKGVKFTVGTEFRATYKGVEYQAIITEEGIEYSGDPFTSVSGAAHAVTGTQVNGLRFWEWRRPGQSKWILIDEVFKKAHKRQTA